MTGRLRYLLAAAFVALFFFMPEADPGHLAYLKTREWLTEDKEWPTGAKHSLLAESIVGGELPPLDIVIDQQVHRKWIDDFERAAKEWARKEGEAIGEDAENPMILRVMVGDDGIRSDFAFPAIDAGELVYSRSRTWLTEARVLDDEDRPVLFVESLVDDKLPPLQVTLDPQVNQEWGDNLGRLAQEWADSQDPPKIIDQNLSPMTLRITLADSGFDGEFLSAGMSEPLRLEIRRDPAESLALSQLTTFELLKDQPGSYFPDRYSLLPAFLAIVLAIMTGKVIPALFLGCLAGAWLLMQGAWTSITHLTRDTIWGDVLMSSFNEEILGFVIFLFMSVGVMTRCGGIQGMVNQISKYARGPVSSQLCSWVIGVLIFFDDYTNCIVTGTTMRPLTDRNRVSREKLSYIVDATAAPVAGVSIFSTWVAYEVSMFAPQLPEVTKADGTPYQQSEGFAVFFETLPFRFYCLFTVVMVLLTIVMRREFGSMYKAEQRALQENKPYADDATPMISSGFDKLEPEADTPQLARNALLPIGSLIVVTLVLIFVYGSAGAAEAGRDMDISFWRQISTYLEFGESQKALFWASMAALGLASILALGQRLLTARDVVVSAVRSAGALFFAVVILTLAWTIGAICNDVGTNHFLTAAFGDSFSPWLLPSVLFLLSALVAFCTGTSYGTMAILLPNVVVLAHTVGQESDIGGTAMMLITIGAVLEGSIFGDHCSPISDTTVLSSVATGSDHIHHVRTQAPYAVFVMIVAMVCGYLPMALFGIEYWWLSWLAGIACIFLWLRFVGRAPNHTAAA